MKKARGLSERASDIVLVAITAVVLIIVAYPLYYVLIASVSDPYDVYAGKTFLFPSGFTLDGYAAVFQDPNIVSGFLNSVKYTVIGTVFSVTMLYITAYPMAQRDLPGRKFLSIFFLITMYFGGGLVPTYLVVKSTGLVGSMWSLFLPGGVAVGNMILVRNYFQNNIPKDLIEAARVDGCSKLGIFLRIVIPLSKPILAVMAVFSMVAYWNDWFTALIYLGGKGSPLPLVMRNILIKSSASASQAATISGGYAELNKLHDALKAFQENDMSHTYYGNAAGSTIPMSTGFDEWCWGQNIFYSGFGFTNWPNDVCNDLHLKSDGTVEFVCVSDAYRDCMDYFHTWFSEGLMDVEMFSQSDSQLMAKCQQGYVGVSTWWYIDELMGEYADDYVFLPPLSGPKGTQYEDVCEITIRPGSPITSGQLCITGKCQSPINLLKFFDQWYDGETVMQLHYGPIGVYFTGQDESGMWMSITDEEAKEKYGKSAGELRNQYETYGPKLILAEYYRDVFYMEPNAINRLTWLAEDWMPYVKDTSVYPVDCTFTSMEMETLDWHKPDFETAVREQEGLWLKNGGQGGGPITDEEWEEYKQFLVQKCGMDDLLQVYQAAYDRYTGAES